MTKTIATNNNRTQIANRLWDKAGLYSICPRLARVIRGTAKTPLIADHAKSDKNTNVIKARILPRPDKMISRDTQPRLSPIPMPKSNVPKNKPTRLSGALNCRADSISIRPSWRATRMAMIADMPAMATCQSWLSWTRPVRLVSEKTSS
jgi:hypothetical protein